MRLEHCKARSALIVRVSFKNDCSFAGFCKAPRNDEIALQHLFFSFLQQCNIFSVTFVLHATFFFRQALAGNIFSKSPTNPPPPPPPARVKWSAPYFAQLFGGSNRWRGLNPKHFKNNVSCGISKINDLLTVSTIYLRDQMFLVRFFIGLAMFFSSPRPFFADRKITQREPIHTS